MDSLKTDAAKTDAAKIDAGELLSETWIRVRSIQAVLQEVGKYFENRITDQTDPVQRLYLSYFLYKYEHIGNLLSAAEALTSTVLDSTDDFMRSH
jgi:hypothetical protein